jgi:hypothetical protein
MKFDRVHSDTHVLGDLTVRAPSRCELERFQLTCGENLREVSVIVVMAGGVFVRHGLSVLTTYFGGNWAEGLSFVSA